MAGGEQPEGDASLRAMLLAGEFRRLHDMCVHELHGRPSDPVLLFHLALALEGLGDLRRATAALLAACEIDATTEMMAQLARMLTMRRRDADAARWADKAIELGLASALEFDTIGCVFARLGRHVESVPLFATAVAQAPDNVQFRYNLATALEFVGDPRAIAQHEGVLLRDRGFARSHFAIATAATAQGAKGRIDRVESALADEVDPDNRLLLHAAAARDLERLGLHDRAFAHLRTGKDMHGKRIDYDFSRDAVVFEDLANGFSDPSYFAGEGLHAPRPIFVIGMPRSGTTLVERILSSHPELVGAGELQAMPAAVKLLGGVRSRAMLDRATIDAVRRVSPAALGETYLKRASSHVDIAQRFVDKLPMNFLYAGYIAKAFPRALLLCLRREPMDVVWSNYKHLFSRSATTFDYSYDVQDCARYVAGFERLVTFWHQVMPGRILDVRYEELIEQPETQIRRILDRAGLDWSDACLNFEANTSPVATPSGSQVRRAIYRDSVGAWRPYAVHLQPARDVLGCWGG